MPGATHFLPLIPILPYLLQHRRLGIRLLQRVLLAIRSSNLESQSRCTAKHMSANQKGRDMQAEPRRISIFTSLQHILTWSMLLKQPRGHCQHSQTSKLLHPRGIRSFFIQSHYLIIDTSDQAAVQHAAH